MQNPPPGPPPGGQPPYQPPGYPPPGYRTAGGIDKRTGAVLAYLLWWITGIIFLFVGKNDPDVKFHAAQSTIFFGAIFVVDFILNRLGELGAGVLLGTIAFLIWVFGVVVWIMAMLRANSLGGARFPLPVVGGVVAPYAEQLANAIN